MRHHGLVVLRHAPGDLHRPVRMPGRGRQIDHVDVGPDDVGGARDVDAAAGALAFAPDAIGRLGHGDLGDLVQAIRLGRDAMDEMDVRFVEVVLDALEVVARHQVAVDRDVAVRLLDLGIAREGRRLAIAEIGEDEAHVLAQRIGRHLDLGGEGRALGRLLEALAGAVIEPAVIEAADAVALDPAVDERGLAMGTAVDQQMRRAALAAIEREIFAHHLYAHRASRGEIGRARDRMPEPAQIAPGQGAGPDMRKILIGAGAHRRYPREATRQDKGRTHANSMAGPPPHGRKPCASHRNCRSSRSPSWQVFSDGAWRTATSRSRSGPPGSTRRPRSSRSCSRIRASPSTTASRTSSSPSTSPTRRRRSPRLRRAISRSRPSTSPRSRSRS